MSVKSDIITEFEQVAKEQDKNLAPLEDDLPLIESGLDSLCFAIVIARLEDRLGIDPFSAAAEGDARFPMTLGELIKSYENAAK
jgi:acyl carrier protein